MDNIEKKKYRLVFKFEIWGTKEVHALSDDAAERRGEDLVSEINVEDISITGEECEFVDFVEIPEK